MNVKKFRKPRFRCIVPIKELWEVARYVYPAKESVVLGYSDHTLRVDGKPVPATWGEGAGGCVVKAIDFDQLAKSAQVAVTIEALNDGWQGWADGGPAETAEGLNLKFYRFRYYGTK